MDPVTVVTRCSVTHESQQVQGFHHPPFLWEDLVDGPPPSKRDRGAGTYRTVIDTDDTADVRLGFATLVRCDDELGLIYVEERVNVQRRLLQKWIDMERAFSERFVARARTRLAHRVLARERLASRLRSRLLASLVLWWGRLQERVWSKAIGGAQTLLRGLVVVPDIILTHSERLGVNLATATGRRAIRRALRDPASATTREKALLVVFLAFGLLGIVLVLNTLIAIALPGWAPAYRHVLADFAATLLSVLALPLPPELLIIASTLTVGALLAFLGPFSGKMLGSWILYLVGDSLHDSIARVSAKRPRVGRAVVWMQMKADRWGFLLLVLISGIPLVPDVLVYVFAVSGMRFSAFMGGIAAGTALKFGAIILGVLLVGPEAIQTFLQNPLGAIRGG